MAILTFEVKGQTLTVKSSIGRIVENSINYLDYEIKSDDPAWEQENLGKYLIITTKDGKSYEQGYSPISGDNIIKTPGFQVSVIGKKEKTDDDNGIQITTQPVFVQVYPSGATEGDKTTETKLPALSEGEKQLIAFQNAVDSIERISEAEEAHGVYNINTLPFINGKLNYTAVNQSPTQARYWIKGASKSILIPYSKKNEDEILYLFSEEKTGEIAFFSEYHSLDDEGNAPCLNFTIGTDTTERNLYEFGASTSVREIHIPDGTKYIYVLCVTGGTKDRLPSRLEIDGYDYCKGVTENIINLGRKFSSIENDYYSALELLGGAE